MNKKIDFEKITDKEFYKLVNNTKKDWVLKQCVENATPEQCEYLAVDAKTDEIAMMFAEKLLPVATPEQCRYLAEHAKTDEIAMMFAKKLLPVATSEQCKYLAKYAKTSKIRMMFADKLSNKPKPYYTQFL